MRLLPREEKFFASFMQQLEVISQAAKLLLEGVKAGNSRLKTASEEIQALEEKGDEIIHSTFTRLNQTFITPIDPEDIHALSSRLDDVIDGIEDTSHRMVAYHLEPIPPTMIEVCEIVFLCTVSMEKAFQALEKSEPVLEHCIEINRLEGVADQLVRKAVADLITKEKDTVTIIKLKEVYEFLEATTDRCEDVADALQEVVVKNS